MADNYNLIPAAELPLTEAKEVDVLCVDNGELKRKAGANLGGGGGYVIHVPADATPDFETPGDDGSLNVNISSVSYDEFIDVLLAGGSLWLDFTALFVALGMDGGAFYGTTMTWTYVPGVGIVVRVAISAPVDSSMQSTSFNVFFTNGTWTPEAAASTGEAEA